MRSVHLELYRSEHWRIGESASHFSPEWSRSHDLKIEAALAAFADHCRGFPGAVVDIKEHSSGGDRHDFQNIAAAHGSIQV